MRRLPAPLRRCCVVFLLASLLAGAHVTFAQAQERSGNSGQTETLGENCYWETETVRTKAGRLVTTRVQECD